MDEINVVEHARKRVKHTDVFPPEVLNDCQQTRIAKFIDATGAKALARSVCTVCAGSFFAADVCDVHVSDLQEKNKLQPFHEHPAQVLTCSMLLHRSPDVL
jgi:hypothetical protein